MMTRPCSELGSHGPLATGVGMKASRSWVKKGWFVMARDHDGIFHRCHRPPKWTIQYAVTYRIISDGAGILDAPLSRSMTAEHFQARRHSPRTLSSGSMPIAP